MTPEERARKVLIEDLEITWELEPYPEFIEAVASTILAAVAEAVAEEREACARQLDEAAKSYGKGGGANKLVASVLTLEAKGIRARSRGEGEG